MTFWGKRAALIAVTAIALVGCTSAPEPADSNIMDKAKSFEKQVQDKLAAQAAAAAEARIVRLQVPKDRPLRVFYAGDSLGAGFHASVQANAYRPLVTARLQQFGEVEELRATKPADAPLFQIGNIQGIPESGVDLAIVELGTNDVGRTDLNLFQQQYTKVLEKLEDGSPGVHIICAGAWGFPGEKGTDPYDKEIQEICESHGGRYIDLTDAFNSPEAYGPAGLPTWVGPSDNFHPNDKGHKLIADLILDRIKVS